MSTPTGQAQQPKPKVSAHDKINKILTTIALVLGIVLMAVAIYVIAEAYYKYTQLQNALSEIGAAPTPVAEQPFDPGALEDEIREPEVRDTGQDLSPFIDSTLGVPIADGTVCQEDGNINAIVCEGPNADNGELYWNGVVIED
jgi:cell division protein FtsL